MFGIDGPELLVIIIVLIVVVGPKDLPKMMRAFGKATARMRETAQEFRHQFDEAMREADIEEITKTLKDVKELDPRRKMTEIFDPIRSVTSDLQSSLRDSTRIAPITETDTKTGTEIEDESLSHSDSLASPDNAPEGEPWSPELMTDAQAADFYESDHSEDMSARAPTPETVTPETVTPEIIKADPKWAEEDQDMLSEFLSEGPDGKVVFDATDPAKLDDSFILDEVLATPPGVKSASDPLKKQTVDVVEVTAPLPPATSAKVTAKPRAAKTAASVAGARGTKKVAATKKTPPKTTAGKKAGPLARSAKATAVKAKSAVAEKAMDVGDDEAMKAKKATPKTRKKTTKKAAGEGPQA